MNSTILIKFIKEYNNLLSKLSLEDKIKFYTETTIDVIALNLVDIKGDLNPLAKGSYLLLDEEGNTLIINEEE